MTRQGEKPRRLMISVESVIVSSPWAVGGKWRLGADYTRPLRIKGALMRGFTSRAAHGKISDRKAKTQTPAIWPGRANTHRRENAADYLRNPRYFRRRRGDRSQSP